MEGDGNEDWVGETAQPRFLREGFRGELGEVAPEFRAFEELELMNEVDAVVCGLKGCGGKIKSWFHGQAIGAALGRRDLAVEFLSAFEASVRSEEGELDAARSANISTLSKGDLAEGADRRVEPIQKRARGKEGHGEGGVLQGGRVEGAIGRGGFVVIGLTVDDPDDEAADKKSAEREQSLREV